MIAAPIGSMPPTSIRWRSSRPQSGLDIYPAPPGQRMRIGRRYAREGEMEDFLASLVRANTAIADAARKGDVACAQVLPKDLGEWRPTVEFVLGPYGCGKDLAEVSTVDFARAAERDNSAFCRQGFGALLAKLAAGLPVQLATPVTGIEYWSRTRARGADDERRVPASAVIVTASTNVLAAGKIKFAPELPKRHLDAVAKLKLGSHDHVALELTGNPLGLRADELAFEKTESRQTAAIFANVSGSTLCVIDVAGNFGRELSSKGEAGDDRLRDQLAHRALRHRLQEHRQAPPCHALGQRAVGARRLVGRRARRAVRAQDHAGAAQRPHLLRRRGAHETLWGTVGGAWESGERAADAVVKLLGGPSKRS